MTKRSFVPVLLVALCVSAVPALAFDGSDNPGVDNRDAKADNGLGREEARALGVAIIDVRLKRADLPEQNLTATFERMKAEREREAADERARGQEAAQRVRAQADRTAIEITSEAERDAQVIRGESDAERNRILAESFGADPEFFAFMRSLDAYRGALKSDNATMMVEPDSAFFDYLHSPEPRARAEAVPPAPVAPAPSASADADPNG